MNLSVEHVLMVVLVAFALHYLMKNCGCRVEGVVDSTPTPTPTRPRYISQLPDYFQGGYSGSCCIVDRDCRPVDDNLYPLKCNHKKNVTDDNKYCPEGGGVCDWGTKVWVSIPEAKGGGERLINVPISDQSEEASLLRSIGRTWYSREDAYYEIERIYGAADQSNNHFTKEEAYQFVDQVYDGYFKDFNAF